MNEEIKEKVEYNDLELEPISLDELEERNNALVENIKNNQIKTNSVGGELVLKLNRGDSMVEVAGKPGYVF